jgi:hypothetical protein
MLMHFAELSQLALHAARFAVFLWFMYTSPWSTSHTWLLLVDGGLVVGLGQLFTSCACAPTLTALALQQVLKWSHPPWA